MQVAESLASIPIQRQNREWKFKPRSIHSDWCIDRNHVLYGWEESRLLDVTYSLS